MLTSERQQPLLLYGASGHAKVVIDIVEKEASYRIKGIIDDNQDLWGQELLGYPIIGGFRSLESQNDVDILIAIGENSIREHVSERLAAQGFSFARAIHPSASLAGHVTIGEGSVVMAGAVINTDSRIGKHVIVNTCASVDHDCLLEDTVHIAPGAHLCGGCTIGKRTVVGAGATVIPNITIGCHVSIGAGSTVVKDVSDNVMVLGTPARVVKHL